MNRLFAVLVVPITAVMVFAGCEDGVQGSPFSPAAEGDQGDGDEPADDAADPGDPVLPEEPGLAGTFGMLLDVSVLQGGLPLLGGSPVESRNWYLVQAVPDGAGGLVTSERLCAVQLVPDTWVASPVVPKAFVEHLVPLRREVILVEGEQGTAWITDRVCEVRGARLCDPEHDPLPGPDSIPDGPASCDDPCDGAACDQDGDGMPGMTTWLVGFYNCAIYSAHRWCSRLEGFADGEDRISGLVKDFSSEQVVLGASSGFCEAGTAVAVPDPCAARHYFEMVRLPQDADCDDVMALTGCDEDPAGCAANPTLPLDPRGPAAGDPCQ